MSELEDRVREIHGSEEAVRDRIRFGASFVEIVDGVPEYVPAWHMERIRFGESEYRWMRCIDRNGNLDPYHPDSMSVLQTYMHDVSLMQWTGGCRT